MDERRRGFVHGQGCYRSRGRGVFGGEGGEGWGEEGGVVLSEVRCLVVLGRDQPVMGVGVILGSLRNVRLLVLYPYSIVSSAFCALPPLLPSFLYRFSVRPKHFTDQSIIAQ